MIRLPVQVHKAAIYQIIHARNIRGRIRTKKQSQCRNLVRFGHSANGLGLRQLVIHFVLSAGIMFVKIPVDERGMHSPRRNAVAPDVKRQVVAGNGISHGDHRALAGRISEAVRQARRGCDGSEVQNHTAAARFHVSERGKDAVVKTLYVDSQHAIKISFGCILCVADVRDARIVYQNVDAIVSDNFGEPADDFGLISNVAGVGRSGSSRAGDFGGDGFGILCADIDNVHRRAIGRELVRDRPADPTPAAGDDCRLTIEAKLAYASIFARQRETPRFQGMKSSWFFCSALVRTSPLATRIT
jgi:hypothetical protein